MVEIAKALTLDCRVLILDEPTAALTAKEAQILFGIMRKLAARGISIIYISHRIEEIFRVSDRIIVLRDGRRVGDLDTRTSSHDSVLALMVGREIRSWFPVRRKVPGEVLLQVEGLRVIGAPGPVSFEGRRGEILGFAGLVGSGRTELVRALFGLEPRASGRIVLRQRTLGAHGASPAQRLRQGFGYLSEDRKSEGLALPLSVADNLTATRLSACSPGCWKICG